MLFRNIKSRSGIVGYVMLTFFLLGSSGLVYLKMNHLLTPGALANYHDSGPLGGVDSHAELSTRCLDCHVPVHCFSDTRCQECHVEIAEDRGSIDTLHGRIPNVSRCQNCHPEHRGAQASLVEMASHKIDHTVLSGYSLAGHAQNYDGSEITCGACHAETGDIHETMDCVTCHAAEDAAYMDEHLVAYGPRCADCHDGRDRMLSEFDHEPYMALTGGHAGLACGDCHAAETALSLACVSCHEDPEVHAGDFGLDCARCHTDDAWTPAELRIHVFELDHADLTAEQCDACHLTTYAEYTCAECHYPGEMPCTHVITGTETEWNCNVCHPTGRPGEGMPPAPEEPDRLPDPDRQTGQEENFTNSESTDTTTDRSGKDG